MAISVTFNGETYDIPTPGNTGWGPTLTAFFRAIASAAVTLTGPQTLQDKTLAQMSPVELSLDNGWSQEELPVYWRDSMNVVHLQGSISGGTTTPGTVIAQLPVGYRPNGTRNFAVSSNGAYGELRVDTSGNIRFQAGSATLFNLDGVTFPAQV